MEVTMLANAALFFANRAASGAVDQVARWATWMAVASLLCITAFVFGLTALFWMLEPTYGAINSAAVMAAVLFVLGLCCIAAPTLIDALHRRAAERAAAKAGPVATTVEAVQQETAAAVDYFGPLQVIASAFLVGLRTGRQFSRPVGKRPVGNA
jgi:hypothetical protein